MWEAIESNRRGSRLLIGLMGALLVILGFVIGLVLDPTFGGALGALAALALWLVLLAVAFVGGDEAILLTAKARQIQKEDSPRLWNVVEEMAIASGSGTLPRIYLIEEEAPNAFAVGQNPDKAAIAVTSGLLARLNRDELQGVIGHEMAHIRNHDVRFMTIAIVMLGSIALISDGFLRALWYGGGRRSSSKGNGQAQVLFLAIAVAVAVLAPLCAQLLYFATSRRREFLADASSARYTRLPDGLASALEKIAVSARGMKGVNRALAPLYIVNPLHRGSSVSSLYSTHPPTELRVRILRSMGGRAGYVDYEAAFRKLRGKDSACIGERTLASEGSVAARQATAEAKPRDEAIERAREVTDILGRLAEFLLIPCLCGASIRVPPRFKRQTIGCPRCGRQHDVPHADRPGEETPAGTTAPMTYRRRQDGWESFRCACGKVVQLSPGFLGTTVTCPSCKRDIVIETAPSEQSSPPPAAPP
jgi:heat shock protein HtpX